MRLLKSAQVRAGATLRGKRILVTGGSQGLGRTLAIAFLEEGALVAVCARHEAGLGPIREAGGLAEAADVGNPDALDRLVRHIETEMGELDGVVNNAAVLREGRVTEQPIEEWRETLEANLSGPCFVVRSALRIMKGGNIVNVTSGLGRFPMEPYGAYCVAKAGLNMLTRVLALELGDRFRVNAIDPGVVRSRMSPGAADAPGSVLPVARSLLLLGPDGPTGRCFRKSGEEEPW